MPVGTQRALRKVGEPEREVDGCFQSSPGLDQPVDQPDLERLFGTHGTPGQDQVRCPAVSDKAR